MVGLDQLAALARELGGHPVEGAAERGELVRVRALLRHAGEEVAAAHAVGGGDQPAHRRHELVGEVEAGPDGGEQEEQRHDDEQEGRGDLDAGAAGLELLVLGDDRLRALDVAQHLGVDEAADDQVGVVEVLEPDDGAHAVAGVAGLGDDVARLGALDVVGGDRLQRQREAEAGLGQHVAARVEHHGLVQHAQPGLELDHLLQPLRAHAQDGAVAVEVRRHRDRVGADVLLVLLEVGLGHRQRVLERGPHPVAEPVLEARVQEEDREHGDDHRGGHRHQAEEQDQPGVQPGAGVPLPPLHDDAHQPSGDDEAQPQQEDEVEVEQQEDGADAGAVRGPLREHDVGREPAHRPPGSSARAPAAAPPRGGATAPASPRRRGAGPTTLLSNAHHRAWPLTADHGARVSGMSRSQIFFRSVFLFRPRMSAAFSWLPRVAERVRKISGRSISRSRRS